MCACRIGTSGLILSDRGLLLDFVFDEIAGGFAFGFRPLLFHGKRGDHRRLRIHRGRRSLNFNRLVGCAYVERGVNFVVPANAQINIRQIESLETSGCHKNRRVASLNVGEAIAALSVGGGHLRSPGFLIANSDLSARDDCSRGIFHDAVEAGGGVRLTLAWGRRRGLQLGKLLQGRLMRVGCEHGRFGQRYDRPPSVERLRNVLNERLRGTCDQRQLHILPILADGVVDDRPALQQWPLVGLLGQENAIRALPNRNFTDVTHENIAIPRSRCGQAHAANVASAGGADEAEIPAHLVE